MTTKEKLMESAKELFADNGYTETKVEDITHKAQVAKGTFYTYFKTKEDIFSEIMENIFEKGDIEVKQIKFKEDLKDNLNLFISFVAKVAFSDEKTFKLVANIFTNPELIKTMLSMHEKFKSGFKENVKVFLEISKSQISEDVLEKIEYIYSPLEKFIKMYIGEIFGLAENCVNKNKLTESEIENHIEFLSEFLYKALKK